MTVTFDHRQLLGVLHSQFHGRHGSPTPGSIWDKMKKIPSLQKMFECQSTAGDQLKTSQAEFQKETDAYNKKYKAIGPLIKGNAFLEGQQQQEADNWNSLKHQVTTLTEVLAEHKKQVDSAVTKVQSVLSTFLTQAKEHVPERYKEVSKDREFQYYIGSYFDLESAMLKKGGGATRT